MHENSYVATCRTCHNLVAAAVDNPEHKREVAKEVAKWVRWQVNIQTVPTEQVRTMTFCSAGGEHKEPPHEMA